MAPYKQNGDPLRGRIAALLLFSSLFVVALAGCLGPLSPDTEHDARTPVPALDADLNERWSGEPFTFDARNSSVERGEIVEWRLDLGDGTTEQGSNISEAQVEHAYEHGGVFLVTLNLTAQSPEGENFTAQATKTVTVHERHAIEERLHQALPLNDTPETSTHGFEVYENATTWELDLNLSNADPLQDAEISIRIADPEDGTVAQENVTLAAGENQTVQLAGTHLLDGDHVVEIIVESGSVRSSGEMRVYYGTDADAGAQ